MDIEKFWRYSLDCGGGGIVIADTIEEARQKIGAYYDDMGYYRFKIEKSVDIWALGDDDCYEPNHPDVIDCY